MFKPYYGSRSVIEDLIAGSQYQASKKYEEQHVKIWHDSITSQGRPQAG